MTATWERCRGGGELPVEEDLASEGVAWTLGVSLLRVLGQGRSEHGLITTAGVALSGELGWSASKGSLVEGVANGEERSEAASSGMCVAGEIGGGQRRCMGQILEHGVPGFLEPTHGQGREQRRHEGLGKEHMGG
jgi:hypothetical protein